MSFCKEIKLDLDDLEVYQLLENEMSKYKTLHHASIKWDRVYEYALILLQDYTIDAKIGNYFMLSCLVLNNELCFEKLASYYETFAQVLTQRKALTQSPKKPENDDPYSLQKKKLKNLSTHFIAEFNKNKLNISIQTSTKLASIFKDLQGLLECEFASLQTPKQPQQEPQISSPVRQVDIKSTRLNSLNDREYRALFLNLAKELLENDANNINAYALFVEAMWGRIKKLPPHKDRITNIAYVNKELTRILLEPKDNELEQIRLFMENLALNPFWIEGIKLFCEFLEKRQKHSALNLLINSVKDFITSFEGIAKLRFEGNEPMCREELFNYFMKQELGSKALNSKEEKGLEQALADINDKNYDNSLFYNINALLDMARLFETKTMPKNAKIIYTQLRELMEKTLLKDYLLEDYKRAKTKSEGG